MPLHPYRAVTLDGSIDVVEMMRLIIVKFPQLPWRKGKRDDIVYIALGDPLVLFVVQRPLDGLELSEISGSIGNLCGLPGIRVHVERKITVNQVHLSRNHIVINHRLYTGFKESAAS